ncbi:MAG: hypothetical protein LBS99_04635, partial [Clostridiales bacterium]|nr:hypothetical protein [Clostridiales bacterium]
MKGDRRMNKRLKASLLSIMMAAVLALGIGLPDALLVRAASDDEQPKLFVPKTISGLASTEFTTSSSALPASPQGFTGGPAGDNSTSNGVVSGIIDTELKSFREHTDSVKDKDTYKLSSYYAAANEEPRQKPELLLTQENPTDGKVLMINNTSQTAYKYATSSMTLDANDYYKISVFVLTCDFLDIPGINSNSGAFIKLSGDIELRSEPINTKFVWQSYTMYVETRNFKSASVTFSLQVGDDGEEFLPAYGFALFDKLVATSITYEQYQRSVSAGQNDSRIIFNSESKSTSYLKDGADNYIHNGDFENGTASNWAKVEDTGFISISTEIINESDFTGAPMGGNKKAAVSSGSTASYGGIASDPFLIQRHRYYYISAYVDTTDIVSGSAVLKITSDEDNDSLDISNSSFTAASANHWRGDWQLASFYISGSAFADKLVNLELWLGSEAAPAKGTVYFDNINIEYITAEVFGASAGGTTVTFAGAVGTAGIANGGFNTIGNYEEFEYPLPVASWTAAGEYLDVENGQTVAGIIATDRTTWAANKDSYGAEINPIESVYGHNALMIWNKTSTYYSYTSETVSVAAAGYTKITVSL